jgi:hypothetical protein
MNMKFERTLILILMGLLMANMMHAGDALEQKFAHPPTSARPWVYTFIVDDNLSKDGITADLEAMKRAGIGGLLVFDATQQMPRGQAKFMSPLWLELFKHLVGEAKRLGLEVSMNNDAGWSGSGGPWNTPENSCQRVVWTTMQVTGPKPLAVPVPPPAANLNYYRDIAVLAFPTPKGDEEGKGYRIERYGSTKSFGGQEDWAGAVGQPRRVLTNPNWPVLNPALCVARDQVVDLTGKLDAKGNLQWTVPAGNWTIMRLGHTPTGRKNSPTTPEGEGLECDKLSQVAMDAHFAGYLKKLINAVGPEAGKTFGATHIDSWEVGTQNWTPLMREEFRKRCGYDLLPFLPVLSGRVVGSLEVSERFLWDFREVIAQLMLKNYAGRLRELAHQHGMQLSIEAYNGLCDEYRYAGQADMPMGEFWMHNATFGPEWVPQMASAAHTYGRNIVPAESFTSGDDRWTFHPAMFKTGADWAFSEGVNRLVFHRFVMQPWTNRAPGVTFGSIGSHFDRTQTWWELSRAWNDYLARSQFLLQQGVFVADICFLEPEGSPVQNVYPIPATQRGGEWPERPGYNFDGCSAEVLFQHMTVKKGMLTLPEGGQYRLLVLPSYNANNQLVSVYGGYNGVTYTSDIYQLTQPAFETMTPAVLQRIKELVKDGATVLGTRPLKSPGLVGYPQCDAEIQRLADELWGKDAGASGTGEHAFGKGRVIWGSTPEKIFAGMNVPPDFAMDASLKGKVRFAHRRLAVGTDIYFVANKQNEVVNGACLFRVSGKRPELWRPETGRIEPLVAFSQTNGCVRVPLRLEPTESVFVVFREKASENNGPVVADQAEPELRSVQEITGPWALRFPPNWGAPEQVTLDKLISWSEHADAGVKYFSGTAVYSKTIQIPANLIGKDQPLYLDLGNVAVIAEVRLNGKNLGTLWKRPFRVDISAAAKAGDNALAVSVVNLWPNRLIRDSGLPEKERLTWTTWNPYKPTDPLLPSGLLGPVRLLTASLPD